MKKIIVEINNFLIAAMVEIRLLLFGLPDADKAQKKLDKKYLLHSTYRFREVEPVPVTNDLGRSKSDFRKIIRDHSWVVASGQRKMNDYKAKVSSFKTDKVTMTTRDLWYYIDKGNWGSARPDNDSVYTKDNFFVDDCGLTIGNTYHPGDITGKDWEGNDRTCKFSSAELWSADA